MSHSKVFLILISVSVFGLMHLSKDFHHRERPFNPKSSQNLSENVKSLPKLYRLASEMAAKESMESLHLDRIIDLSMELLKLHHTNDRICKQVFEMVTIFQSAIQIKAKIFQRLQRTLLMVRTLKTIPNGIINRLHDQFVCVQRFTSCMDLDMVARKLASSRVEVIVDAVEALLPYAKIYSTELDACVNVLEPH